MPHYFYFQVLNTPSRHLYKTDDYPNARIQRKITNVTRIRSRGLRRTGSRWINKTEHPMMLQHVTLPQMTWHTCDTNIPHRMCMHAYELITSCGKCPHRTIPESCCSQSCTRKTRFTGKSKFVRQINSVKRNNYFPTIFFIHIIFNV